MLASEENHSPYPCEISENDRELATELIEDGQDVNAQDAFGTTH